jgi:hypothetical protein
MTTGPDAACKGSVRQQRRSSYATMVFYFTAACYFALARKLGVGSSPMSACLTVIAVALAAPAGAP